jgi:thymidylate kinase
MSPKRARVVSFSGIDGAGKSTQILALIDHLRSRGLSVSLYTFWDDVVVLAKFREFTSHKAFGGDKGIGSPEKPIERRDKNVRSWYTSIARMCFYLFDAVSLRFKFLRVTRGPSDFVIFDRYIYDELANFSIESSFMRLYVKSILKLSPSPDIAFLVDADPEAAFQRKPEYPLEFVRKNRDQYHRLSMFIPVMKVVGPGPMEEIKSQILSQTSRLCSESSSSSATLRFPTAFEENPKSAL